MTNKQKSKKKAQTKTSSSNDFRLNPKYYLQQSSFEVYGTEKKVTKIFGVKNKSASYMDYYIKSRTRSKTPRGWRYLYGIDLLNSTHIARFIQGVLVLAEKLGWKVKQTEDLKIIKAQLRNSEEAIIHLEASNKDWREKHEKLMTIFKSKQEEVLRSSLKDFKSDVKKLKELIKNGEKGIIPEQDLQDFLYEHPWLFGTEYVNAEPQKLRGAHSKFDFYLERFNKTNDIVEIKLLSDQIVNKNNSISAKVLQAVDQAIEYMESSQAAAHSTVISEEEGIRELRPRGIVIIGSDSSQNATKKLQKWNYQLTHISVLTYKDVLERAKTVLNHLRSK